jgi:hypothetical protein
MKHRQVRIVWSVGWSVATLVLAMLWLEDYRSTRLVASMPYAFPLLACIGLTLAPWTSGPTRFSLQALIIAVTLVAVVLGLVVMAVRN